MLFKCWVLSWDGIIVSNLGRRKPVSDCLIFPSYDTWGRFDRGRIENARYFTTLTNPELSEYWTGVAIATVNQISRVNPSIWHSLTMFSNWTHVPSVELFNICMLYSAEIFEFLGVHYGEIWVPDTCIHRWPGIRFLHGRRSMGVLQVLGVAFRAVWVRGEFT